MTNSNVKTRVNPVKAPRPRLSARAIPHIDKKKQFVDQREKVKQEHKQHNSDTHESANPDLDAAYRDDRARRMLDYLEIEEGWLTTNDGRGMSFPCIVNPERRAVVKRGKDGQFVYGMLKPDSNDPVPAFYPLPMIFAVVDHGYKLGDARLGREHAQVYGSYKGLLAVLSGAFEIDRTPLPLSLPDDVLVRLNSDDELRFTVKQIIYFWLRMDLAKTFTAKGFRYAKNSIMYSRDYRGMFLPIQVRELVPDETRRNAIWKLLTNHGVIEQFKSNYRTYYRIAEQDLQERFDARAFRKMAELQFGARDETRKMLARIRSK